MNRLNSPYPSLSQAWLIFVIFLAVSTAAGLLLGAVTEIAGIQNVSIANFFGYNLSMGFVIWFAWRYRQKVESRILFFQPIRSTLYPLLLLFTLAFGVFLDPITNLIPMPEFMEKLLAMLAKKDIWTFLMVGITGPVLEEILFRGMILDGFLKRYKPGKAIFWSAFLFGLFHLNPWQFIPGFLMGLVLGYIYYRTRSLIPVIGVHIMNNSFSYLIMYIYGGDVTSFADIFPDTVNYYLFLGASTILAALSLYLIIKIISIKPEQWTLNSKTDSLSSPEPAADSEKL